jgi:hypothetical protein
MRKPSVSCAPTVERLEDRLVLSHAGHVSTAAPITPQEQTTAKVNAAYTAFVHDFGTAVNNDLYLPSVSGAMGSNVPFFSQQLGQDLTTLERRVLKTLSPGSAGSPAATKVRQSILGSGKDSLKSKLSALTMSSMEVGSSISGYESAAMQEIRQNFMHVDQQVLGSLPSSGSASTATPAKS